MAIWSYTVHVKINSLPPHHSEGRSMVYSPLLICCTTESIRQIPRCWKPLRKLVATLYNQTSSRHLYSSILASIAASSQGEERKGLVQWAGNVVKRCSCFRCPHRRAMENPFLHSLTSGFICYFLLFYVDGGGEENEYRCTSILLGRQVRIPGLYLSFCLSLYVRWGNGAGWNSFPLSSQREQQTNPDY